LPENRGYQCLNVYRDSITEGVLIEDGAYSIAQYKDWIDNNRLVTIAGKVELRKKSHPDYKENTMVPALIAEKIEIELTPQPKTSEIRGSTRPERLKDFE
jgi:hypothetical protein